VPGVLELQQADAASLGGDGGSQRRQGDPSRALQQP